MVNYLMNADQSAEYVGILAKLLYRFSSFFLSVIRAKHQEP